MNDSRERRFTVSDGQQTYAVEATQTHRPGSYSMEPQLEWQFYIEELHLILIQDGNRYVSIDDPSRLFKVVDTESPYETAGAGGDQKKTNGSL